MLGAELAGFVWMVMCKRRRVRNKFFFLKLLQIVLHLSNFKQSVDGLYFLELVALQGRHYLFYYSELLQVMTVNHIIQASFIVNIL